MSGLPAWLGLICSDDMKLGSIRNLAVVISLLISAIPVCSRTPGQRPEEMRVSLVDAGGKLAVAVREKDINGIMRLCGSYEVAIAGNRSLSCEELRDELTRQADDNDLYCRLFDSACFQKIVL